MNGPTPSGGRPAKPALKRRLARPSASQLDRLIRQATVDAYGASEQRAGLFTMLEDELALPFETEILGVPAAVEKIELTAADQIVAVCRRGRARLRVHILDVPLPTPPPAGAQWIAAYRRWLLGK